jgi:hypothetical protein
MDYEPDGGEKQLSETSLSPPLLTLVTILE